VSRTTRRSALVTTMLAALVAVLAMAQASRASDGTSEAIRQGLVDFASTAGDLADLGPLRDAVPLTGLDPAGADALGLDTLADLVFGALPTSFADLDALEAALEGLDGTYAGVAVTVGCASGNSCATPATVTEQSGGRVDVSLPLTAARAVAPPFAISTSAGDFGGGNVRTDLELSTTLEFGFDPSDPGGTSSNFFLRTPPAIDLDADLTLPAPLSFDASFGFTGITVGVSGPAAAPTTLGALNLDVTFTDPDGDGRITREEFQTTAISDLVTVGVGGAVDAVVTLDSDLTPATDVTLTLSDSNVGDGLDVPTVTLGALDAFDNITPENALSGLAQLATALDAAQDVGDLELPFLDKSLTQTFEAAQPLLDFVARQSVVCGTSETTPPTGSIANLAAGTTVFCQAINTDVADAGSITWTIANGTGVANTSGANADGTVGATPTTHASFMLDGPGTPQVTASYAVGGASKTAEQAPRTAQQLAAKLASLAGFDAGAVAPGYDESSRILTFRLVKTFNPDAIAAGYDFGDQLEAASGVIGLSSDGTASLSVDVSDVALDLTFGLILVDDVAQITPADNATAGNEPSELDRFFLKVNSAAPEFQVGTASFTGTLPTLEGRLGFLKVNATATDFTVTPTANPLLAVEVSAPGIPVGATVIPDAIRIRELLFNLVDRVSVSAANLSMNGALTVTATAADDTTTLGSGTVTIDWPDVTDGLPDVDIDPQFGAQLRAFDLSPNVFGTHSGTNDAPVLTDISKDFTTYPTAVGARLTNLTDGSSCEVTAVATNTVTCTLAGGQDNDWDNGDEYRLAVGDPLALLRLILDNLDLIAGGLDTVSGGAASDFLGRELPLVGTSPNELLDQFRAITQTTQELRGVPGAAITCGTTDAQPPTGDPSLLSATTTVYCSAVHTKPATAVDWDVEGTGTSVTANETSTDTVGVNPTGRAAFSVPAGAIASEDNPDGYRFVLTFTDADGEHRVEFPSLALPPTLQRFETALEDKLGLPADAFALDIVDLSGTRSLALHLNYGIDGTEAVPLNVDLPDVGGLVSVGAQASVDLAYSAAANLHLGVPLTTSPVPVVLDTTGVTVSGSLSSNGIALSANLGPLNLDLGTAATQTNSPATGVLKTDATFTLTGPGGNVAPGAWISGATATFTSDGTGDGCGEIDADGDPATTATETLDGLACAKLSVGAGKEYLGDLGIEVTSLDPLAVTPYVPDDLGDRLLNALLDWELLLRALPGLLEDLEEGLSGAAQGVKVPIVGGALDAGAGVVNQLRAGVVTPLIDTIGPQLDALGNSAGQGDLAQKIRDVIYPAVGPDGAGLLRTLDGSAASSDPSDIDVRCNGKPCVNLPGLTVGNLDDVRLTMNLGQSAGTPAAGAPFDIGLDGLPLRITGAVDATAGWNVLADFGLSRTDGPYLVVAGDGHGSAPEVRVGAEVSLADSTDSCRAEHPQAVDGITFAADDARCLDGTLGFIGVNARDAADVVAPTPGTPEPSSLTLATDLNLSNSAGGDRITFTDLTSGNLDAGLGLGFDANVDLRVRTGLRSDESAGFPSVVGVFALDWSVDTDSEVELPTVAFNQLNLDVGSFLRQYYDPTIEEIRKVTSPLKPVVDTLNAPIPVVADLADLVGLPRPTFLDLMEQGDDSGNNLTVIKSLVAFIDLANTQLNATGLIPLGPGVAGGSFSVDPNAAQTPQTPTTAGNLIAPGAATDRNLFAKSDLADEAVEAQPTTDDALPGTFGVPGLTFPIMDDSSRIFAVLMGKDETLVRYDLGTMRATAGLDYDFGPFFIGPVPVTAGIFGSATIQGRFAVGYDTSGLRQVLNGASGEHLLDGIFIDDLDLAGTDVPEVSLIGTVGAQAGVTVVVATAGIAGGIELTVDLNLNDAPEPDGKLRIQEVFDKLDNPICLFDVDGRLEAFLNFFLEIDYFVDSQRWDWEIVRVTLLDFSGACDPPEPLLAVVGGNGTTSDPDDRALFLLMGSQERREQRGIQVDERDEKFTVRPVSEGRYSVSAFGVYQEFGDAANPITQIVAQGEDGNDVIALEPGATNAVPGTPLPFAAVGSLDGGADNDQLIGGDAGDTLRGGPGNDVLKGGAGADTIEGGDGDDAVAGEIGDDTALSGGPGNDRVNGGPGADTALGDEGNDFVTGGPGADPNASPAPAAGTADLGDTVVGGLGRDQVEGGFGDDTVIGDDDPGGDLVNRCAFDGGASDDDNDVLEGGLGNDTIIGGGGQDSAAGGPGDDDVCGNGGNDTLDGDNPVPGAPNGADFVDGGLGNDSLLGRDGADVLRGSDGNDTADGGKGNDDVLGGLGSDVLTGGEGKDVLVGDTGTINGSSAAGAADHELALTDAAALVTEGSAGDVGELGETCAPSAVPGATADCLLGGADQDVLFGEGGGDRLLADDGTDYLDGGSGNDNMRGGALGDIAYGRAGDDRMFGDSGADLMFGNDDEDVLRGGLDDDELEGNGGADEVFGDAGSDNVIGGSSTAGAADDGDALFGNAGIDFIVGDNAALVRTTDTDPNDGAQVRTVTLHDIGAGDAAVAGPDVIAGGDDNDRIWGQGENDEIAGGLGRDLIQGNADTDTINGDDGSDLILGGSNGLDDPDAGDVINGGPGNDVVLGDNGAIAWDGSVTPGVTALATAFGDDVIHGDGGYDQLYGELGADDVFGDAGPDYLIGDLATISPTAGAATPTFPGGAVRNDVVLVEPDNGGADELYGGDADDHAYGGAADDTIEGNLGDDHLEGNGGRDTMFGFNATLDDGTAQQSDVDDLLALGVGTDQDDLIGGSSSVHPLAVRSDVGEHTMAGNAAQDVLIGDNGEIVRGETADGSAWLPDPITGGVARTVTLNDREKTGAALVAVSGGDRILGNAGNDRAYGQGGDDLVKGNADEDFLEGNQDSDWVEGNGGEDDLLGGSSALSAAGVGDPDGADVLQGGADADVLLGDNGIISRVEADPGPPYQYVTRQLGVARQRFIRLHDLADPPAAANFGADSITGGEGIDVAFGQDGGDFVTGGAGEDYLEGNGAKDRLGGDRTLAALGAPAFPASVAGFADYASAEPELSGPAAPDGQDDQIGGSSIPGFRDTGDVIFGDGAADFQLGDNGELLRTIVDGAYTTYVEANATTVVRLARRFDVGGPASAFGNDYFEGNGGDDVQYGQDGNDEQHGNADNDDQYGELGDDLMFGEEGQDAMVGDRGVITNRLIDGSPGDPASFTIDHPGPPFLSFVAFRPGTLHRQVDLLDDGDGAPVPSPGLTAGGNDRMRGGPGRDSMHGAFGADLLNGDSGGDIVFGDDGGDALWGGRGHDTDLANRGVNDEFVDYLFGGHGGPQTDLMTETDFLDYRPRPGKDPAVWFEMTGLNDADPANDQHHQGVDWQYGGFDRDVLQGDLTGNGPNDGDRMIDWTGAFNLYTHCNAAYGGQNDIRAHSPRMQDFLQRLAFASGAGKSLSDVTTSGTSAFRELGLVFANDIRDNNSGKAYPTTPGHFEAIACDNS
jgi:Ca2+-binding RTX toxin-like protein